MAKVNFYLKNKKAENKSMIILSFNYENRRLKIATGISIYPKYWNIKAQSAREIMEYPQHADVNKKILEYRILMVKAYNDLLDSGIIPDPDTLKNEFLSAKDSPAKKIRQNSFWDYFEEFIEHKKKQLPDVRDYTNSLRKHLKKTEKLFGKTLTIPLLEVKNDGFIARMDDYLTYEAINAKNGEGLTTNTIGKQFKNLKVFLNWYFDKGIFPRFSTKHIVTKSEEVENIYLTEMEIEKLENLETEEPLNEKETEVRDLFLIGCETGLRFSDYTTLKKEYIKNGNLILRPKKTEEKVLNNKIVIPISSRLKRVLDKRLTGENNFQKYTNTEFNTTIRQICKKAKIDEDVLIYSKIAGKKLETVYKKYELVSSHTCRRTFCTLKFLAGMPSPAIMKFSGHKTERAFLRYLKLDAELAAIKYVDFFK